MVITSKKEFKIFPADLNLIPSGWMSTMLPLSYQIVYKFMQDYWSHQNICYCNTGPARLLHNLRGPPFSRKINDDCLPCFLYKSFFYETWSASVIRTYSHTSWVLSTMSILHHLLYFTHHAHCTVYHVSHMSCTLWVSKCVVHDASSSFALFHASCTVYHAYHMSCTLWVSKCVVHNASSPCALFHSCCGASCALRRISLVP